MITPLRLLLFLFVWGSRAYLLSPFSLSVRCCSALRLHRRLVAFDAEAQSRTKIYDLASCWFDASSGRAGDEAWGSDTWLTPAQKEEKALLLQRLEQAFNAEKGNTTFCYQQQQQRTRTGSVSVTPPKPWASVAIETTTLVLLYAKSLPGLETVEHTECLPDLETVEHTECLLGLETG